MNHFFSRRLYAVLDLLYKKVWNMRLMSSSVTYVLMYHEVRSDMPTDSCHHTIEEFKNTIERLKKKGTQFIPIDQLLCVNKKGKLNRCVITFDDVPESFYINSYPILMEENIPFTLFVSQRYIGEKGFLSKAQLLELANNPLCTIGAHTLSHCMLRNVRNSREELLQSKIQLEELLGKEVNYLAYPFGKHSSVSLKVRRQAKGCGYKAAFGTIDAPITCFTSLFRYYLPRMVVR